MCVWSSSLMSCSGALREEEERQAIPEAEEEEAREDSSQSIWKTCMHAYIHNHTSIQTDIQTYIHPYIHTSIHTFHWIAFFIALITLHTSRPYIHECIHIIHKKTSIEWRVFLQHARISKLYSRWRILMSWGVLRWAFRHPYFQTSR